MFKSFKKSCAFVLLIVTLLSVCVQAGADKYGDTSRSVKMTVGNNVILTSYEGVALVDRGSFKWFWQSQQGREDTHGFYDVYVYNYPSGSYVKHYYWCPDSKKVISGGVDITPIVCDEVWYLYLGSNSTYTLEIVPMSGNKASTFWTEDSIVRWVENARWTLREN